MIKELLNTSLSLRESIVGLFAGQAGSHRRVPWFPGEALASPGNQETSRWDPAMKWDRLHLLLSFTFPYINWPITEGARTLDTRYKI